MEFIEELAMRIWANPEFHYDLASLEAKNFFFGQHHENALPQTPVPLDAMTARVLQAASIFALSEEDDLRSVAQRISTAALNLSSHDDAVAGDVFAVIQARLANFPALVAEHRATAPKYAPLSVQFDFINQRQFQTIVVGSSAHELTLFQREGWSLLNSGRSGTLTGPTSAGKSYVVQLYIAERFSRDDMHSAVYVVPTRALINQVAEDMAAQFERRGINVQVVSVPVDMGDTPSQKTLYVFTQERLEVLLISNPNKRFDLVVVDEAQIIADGARGVLLELVLDRVRGPSTQVAFLGPMISNPDYFARVLEDGEFRICSTTQSPVTQRIIYLDYTAQPSSAVTVQGGSRDQRSWDLAYPVPIRLLTDLDKISYLSHYFGRNGSSIVYANGKADAEKIAIKIADLVDSWQPLGVELEGAIFEPAQPRKQSSSVQLDEQIIELIKFVKKHVHPDYALASTLRRGVGFHYGHMPSLLRKELERCFKERRISFLACTSTLLYGLNLPARNIFLHKPRTGKDTPISGPDFWNLAGRVGRLGKEREGDVYLIDYDDWASHPVAESKQIRVSSALKNAVSQSIEEFEQYISMEDAPSGADDVHEIALGKLTVDAREGKLDHTLSKFRTDKNAPQIESVRQRIAKISSAIALPTEVLNRNVGVSPYRQQDLLNYMLKRLKSIQPEEIIPAHPLGDFAGVLANHQRAFKRIHTYLLRYAGKDRRHLFFAGLSLRWMRGDSLPQLINAALKWNKEKGANKSTATVIRNVMENVEDDLRFRYVKYFTAYNSILSVALVESGLKEFVPSIPDIPLFLEVGGSSGVMVNFMALGLSRTSAEELSVYTTDKDMSVPNLRAWLGKQELSSFDLSPAVFREVQQFLQDQPGGVALVDA